MDYLSGGRDQLVVATKVSSHPEHQGLSAANVAAAARESLRRLQTDHIDLYLAYYDDSDTPLEETVTVFAELVDRGVVRYVGLSNYTADRIAEWIETAQRLGVAAPVALEPHDNLRHREPFASELRPLAQRHELGVLPYFGLAAGFLTGTHRSPEDAEGVARGSMVAPYVTDAGFAAADEYERSQQQQQQLPPLLTAATLELDSTELERRECVSDAFAPA